MTEEPPPPARRGMGRVAFYALRETVKAELDAGYTVRMIYDRHREAIPVSYEQFRAYIARDITGTAGSRGGRVNRRNARPVPARQQPPAAGNEASESTIPTQPAPSGPPNPTMWSDEQGILQRGKVWEQRTPDLDALVFGIKRKPDQSPAPPAQDHQSPTDDPTAEYKPGPGFRYRTPDLDAFYGTGKYKKDQ